MLHRLRAFSLCLSLEVNPFYWHLRLDHDAVCAFVSVEVGPFSLLVVW